jgi:hypothetical protein
MKPKKSNKTSMKKGLTGGLCNGKNAGIDRKGKNISMSLYAISAGVRKTEEL